MRKFYCDLCGTEIENSPEEVYLRVTEGGRVLNYTFDSCVKCRIKVRKLVYKDCFKIGGKNE